MKRNELRSIFLKYKEYYQAGDSPDRIIYLSLVNEELNNKFLSIDNMYTIYTVFKHFGNYIPNFNPNEVFFRHRNLCDYFKNNRSSAISNIIKQNNELKNIIKLLNEK